LDFQDILSDCHERRETLLGTLLLPELKIPILGVFIPMRAVGNDAPLASIVSCFSRHFSRLIVLSA